MIDFLHEYAGPDGLAARLRAGRVPCMRRDPRRTRRPSEEIRTCITGAHFFDGKRVRTIEGHAKRDDTARCELSPVQQKFLEHFSFQCGYCTPGFVNAATVLVERLKHEPVAKESRRRRRSCRRSMTHLCRCTGYVRYYEAVKDARARDARAREGRRNEPTPLCRSRLCARGARAGFAPCWRCRRAGRPRRRRPPHPADAAQIARGRYLVKAADCAACHTAPGGAPFAGGVRSASPFGTFYGTNITPDPEHGIGDWSAAEFYKALHDGVTPAAPVLSGNAVHVVPVDVARRHAMRSTRI